MTPSEIIYGRADL